MRIRILEDLAEYNLTKGVKDVLIEIARELISKGYAVRFKETAIDHEAHDSLQHAKERDQAQ